MSDQHSHFVTPLNVVERDRCPDRKAYRTSQRRTYVQQSAEQLEADVAIRLITGLPEPPASFDTLL